jgi:hypothetical protein
MGKPDREAIFEDLFKVIPPSRDQEPPYLLSAFSFGDQKRVSLLFSEPMDQALMLKPECYSVGQSPPSRRLENWEPRLRWVRRSPPG